MYSIGLMGEVYKPGEDSYLLQKYVEGLVSGRVLDMGTGSGIQAVTAAAKNLVQFVCAVDINPAALIAAERRALDAGVLSKIEFRLSDLFNNIEAMFDWIIFNPPYLPSSQGYDEASWAGGDTGGEVIKCFLEEAPRYLMAGGSILMIYSSHSGLEEADFNGYDVEYLEEIGLFFEKIYCVRLTPS
ncbi:methyltransferase [Candidatus Bathyarchaeota archaeon]|nr:methyltransferase [Candidatus Bathyarchaeota archaeon]